MHYERIVHQFGMEPGPGFKPQPGAAGWKGHTKPPNWIGRASHMSHSALDLAPSTAFCYRGQWRSKPTPMIYLLDQAMAKAGIDYFAAIADFVRHPSFTVYVRVKHAERAKAVMADNDLDQHRKQP